MARIDLETLKKIEKERNTIHSKVLTTYTVFDVDGARFVQLDTYGKSDRVMPEKISQSFQIDYESAVFLVKLLVNEFGLTVKID